MDNLRSVTDKISDTGGGANQPDADKVKSLASESTTTVIFRIELGKPLQVETISNEFHSQSFHGIRWRQLIVVARYLCETSSVVLKVDGHRITPTEILRLSKTTKIGLCGSIDAKLLQENRDELEKCHIYFLAKVTDNCIGLTDDLFYAIPVEHKDAIDRISADFLKKHHSKAISHPITYKGQKEDYICTGNFARAQGGKNLNHEPRSIIGRIDCINKTSRTFSVIPRVGNKETVQFDYSTQFENLWGAFRDENNRFFQVRDEEGADAKKYATLDFFRDLHEEMLFQPSGDAGKLNTT